MSKIIKNSSFILALFSSLIIFSLQVSAQINEEIEKSFSLTSQSDFSLSNVNGTVIINSWSKNKIKVLASVTAQTQDSRDDISISMAQHGQKVTVNTDYKGNGYRQNKQTAKVDFQVWLPENSTLSAIELINGGLVIKDIAGKIEAQVVNGTIRATGLSGDINISSVNGSVYVLYDKNSDNLNNIDVETVNGSIKLFLPESTNANITADTMHGKISNTYGLTAEKNNFFGRNLRGELGNGGGQINLDSVNGNINVFKSEE